MAKATFYHHFRSKDELVGVWLEMPHIRFLDWIAPEAERRASTPIEAVIEFFKVLGEWFENGSYRGCPFINTAAEFSDQEHPARRALKNEQGAIVHWFETKLRAAGTSDPHRLAEQLILIAAGAMVRAVSDPSAEAAESAVAAAETLLRSPG